MVNQQRFRQTVRADRLLCIINVFLLFTYSFVLFAISNTAPSHTEGGKHQAP